jgi:hypothetical protein
MKVAELVTISQALPNQEATVIIGHGEAPDTWLIATGIIERQIALKNADEAGPGDEPAIEIV